MPWIVGRHARQPACPETASQRSAPAYHAQPCPPAPRAPDDDACYLALKAQDARFDGSFFTGVTSTGIYCRPVCRVRTPQRENCRFFTHAAQAEQAGFRPCLRCRPELAPGSQHLVHAGRLRHAGAPGRAPARRPEPAGRDAAPAMTALAARLGVSDRHLRRIFEAQLGVSPLQYLQTRRLLTAKQLLTDTDLPVTQRRAGQRLCQRAPLQCRVCRALRPATRRSLRREGRAREARRRGRAARATARPTTSARCWASSRERCIAGHGVRDGRGAGAVLGRTLRLQAGGQHPHRLAHARFDPSAPERAAARERFAVRGAAAGDLRGCAPCSTWTPTRRPSTSLLLHRAAFPDGDGLRVPGALDGFELAVRAVLGQQITVAAARTLAPAPGGALRRAARDALARAQPAVPDARRRWRRPAATRWGSWASCASGRRPSRPWPRPWPTDSLTLHGGADVHRHPGRPEGTARHRRLDGAVHRHARPALARRVSGRRRGAAEGAGRARQAPGREAERASQAWQPWRSYAVMRAWHRAPRRPPEYSTINSRQCP